MLHHHKETVSLIALPIALALAGAFIGLGIYAGAREMAAGAKAPAVAAQAKPATSSTSRPAPISAQDHVRGNRDAKVVIFEYSDLECPFCKRYHDTLKTTLAKYKPSDVAWVYRHFPLSIHDKAPKEAEASECAAEQGGDAKFWAFVDRLFEVSPTNNKLDPAELPKIAAHVGLNVPAFEKCLSSGKYAAKVDAQRKEGATAGASGTPYSVITWKTGHAPLKGAVAEATLEQTINEALKKN